MVQFSHIIIHHNVDESCLQTPDAIEICQSKIAPENASSSQYVF
jgi:hypothetical protein